MPKHARSQPGYESPMTDIRVSVYDDRPELGNPMKHVATFNHVPEEWTSKRILSEFGIAEHLHVIREGDVPREVIQHGRQ